MGTYCEQIEANMSQRDRPDYLPIFLAGTLTGTIFTICFLIKVRVSPQAMQNISMTYSDFITVMLTAVTVIITMLAVFIGVLAVWGYAQFERMTKDASKDHLEKFLLEGPFSRKIEKIIVEHVSTQLKAGELRDVLAARIDNIILSDASVRANEDTTTSNEKPFTD